MENVSTVSDFSKWAAARKIELIPEVCGFKTGQQVSFTNDYGRKFSPYMIIGISKDNSFYGRQIYINYDCYWFPCTPENLTPL